MNVSNLCMHTYYRMYTHTSTYTQTYTQWSIFLQERVVSEIYSMALSERNQQALCQVTVSTLTTNYMYTQLVSIYNIMSHFYARYVTCYRLVSLRGFWPNAVLCCPVMVTLSMKLWREPLRNYHTSLSLPLTSGNLQTLDIYDWCVHA